MRTSARNQIKGVVKEVHKGTTTSHVEVTVAPGTVITAAITNESVDKLGIKKGEEAWVIIKASDVMIGVQ